MFLFRLGNVTNVYEVVYFFRLFLRIWFPRFLLTAETVLPLHVDRSYPFMRLLFTRVNGGEVFSVHSSIRSDGRVLEPAVWIRIHRADTWTILSSNECHTCIVAFFDGWYLTRLKDVYSGGHVCIFKSIEIGTIGLFVDVQFKLNELGDDASIGCSRGRVYRGDRCACV